MLLMPQLASAQSSAEPASAPTRSAAAKPKPAVQSKTLAFNCRVLYEPARTVWVRELALDYSKKTFTALRIDGIAVHGFSVDGAQLVTHLDNERIFIDLSAPSWRSQFRDQAQGEGACVKQKS